MEQSERKPGVGKRKIEAREGEMLLRRMSTLYIYLCVVPCAMIPIMD